MTIAGKPLFDAQDASLTGFSVYLVTSGIAFTIIDKITAYNHSGSAVDISIYLVPYGSSPGPTNLVDKMSVNSAAGLDFTRLQNHILKTGDYIHILASTGTAVCVRGSGREVTS